MKEENFTHMIWFTLKDNSGMYQVFARDYEVIDEG